MDKYLLVLLLIASLSFFVEAKKSKEGEKPAWAKKDIRDYTDADLERLLDQWDVSEDQSNSNPELNFKHIIACPTGGRRTAGTG